VRYLRPELRISSSLLDSYALQDVWKFIATMTFKDILMDQPVGDMIQRWLRRPQSKILWIRGQDCSEYPNPVSAIAVGFVKTCFEFDFPFVAFFCCWPVDYSGSSKQEKQEHCLLDMVCSIIRQLVDQLPPELETELDLGRNRFAELQTDFLKKWTQAMGLVEDLLALISTPLFIVIDGLEHLDYTSEGTRLRVTEIASILVSSCERAASAEMGNAHTSGYSTSGHRFVKVLFSTGENCQTLVNAWKASSKVAFDIGEVDRKLKFL